MFWYEHDRFGIKKGNMTAYNFSDVVLIGFPLAGGQ